MAMIECPQCGGPLSTSAPACPRCQHVPTEEEVSLATSHEGPPESQAIAQCSECGGKVSDRLNSCPHCGAPNPKHQQASPVAGGTTLSDTEASAAREGVARLLEEEAEAKKFSPLEWVFIVIGGIFFFWVVVMLLAELLGTA